MLEVVEVVVAKLVEVDLHVGLHQAGVACVPGVVAIGTAHVGHAQEVVAVVYQHAVEGGGVEMLDFAGLKGQHDVEFVALLGLKHRRGRRVALGSRGRHIGLHELALDLDGALIGTGLSLGLVHDHNLAAGHRALKAVFIFHIYRAAVDTGHCAASHIVEEAHDIIHFYHSVCVYTFQSIKVNRPGRQRNAAPRGD